MQGCRTGSLALLLPLASMLWACASGPEQASSDRGPVAVESLLTVEEFREAGLDQLSDGELAALDAALNRALGRGEAADGVDQAALAAWEASDDDAFATFGFEHEHPAARAKDQMTAKLEEAVREWRSGTRFKLSNGQVWEVAGSPNVSLPSAESGQVLLIRRGMMGSFRMNLEGENRRINVRRKE